MRRISLPITRLRPHYDVVIVGSGYGGAAVAWRLSRVRVEDGDVCRPLRVCMLERGLELQPGDYPSSLVGGLARIQVDTPRMRVGRRTGLFDFHMNRDISTLVGCGLGGGSLINAGVAVEPSSDVWDDWPAGVQAAMRSGDYHDAAMTLLRAKPYPEAWQRPQKLVALEAVEERLRSFERPPIAVSYTSGENHAGVQMRPCNGCGDCVTGCNHSAKNTLITNYLPLAVRNGVEVFCGVAARSVEEQRDRSAAPTGRWIVNIELTDPSTRQFRPRPMFVTADRVVLAAGTLGSTEILMRSRRNGLPVSSRLGARFTGNADSIVFGYNNDDRIDGIGHGRAPDPGDAVVGPTITGVLDERGPGKDGFYIQEGAIPGLLAQPLRVAFPVAARFLGRDTDRGDTLREWFRELMSLVAGPRRGALARTQTYLVMGREEGFGRMALWRDRVRIAWNGVGRQGLFRRIVRRIQRASRKLGGNHVVNPLWHRAFGRGLITVHPLGGCAMGEDGGDGAVNEMGQVFRGAGEDVHDTLYVADGAVVRSPLGANPLLSISALAGWIADGVARDIVREAQSGAEGPSATDPEPGWLGPAARALPFGLGFRFAEHLTGRIRMAGDAGPSPLGLWLTIEADDLSELVEDDAHPARITGSARASALSPHPLMVSDGTFNLFEPVREKVETVRMGYRFKLTARDGRVWTVSGEKEAPRGRSVFAIWRDLSRLRLDVHDETGKEKLGAGLVRVRARDLLRMLFAFSVPGARTLREAVAARFRFLRFFAGSVARIYSWPVRSTARIDLSRVPAPTRRLELPEPVEHPVTAADGVPIRLTRFRRGPAPRGPVILAPGYGMSTEAFITDTIEQNMAEYFVEQGYDVWLLDYRSSERSGSELRQSTLDEIARHDFPAAVRTVQNAVRAENGGEPEGARVKFFGHCVASGALLMALLRGWLDETQLRSAVCAQFLTHPHHPWFNRLKAYGRLATLADVIGFWSTLTPDYDRDTPFDRFADRALRWWRGPEACRSPVCRRIRFMYGDVNIHARLNEAAHDAMHLMFNHANITSLRHLARTVRKSRLVDADGRDVYVTRENAQRIRVPVTLVQGTANRIFRRPGGIRSLRWLEDNVAAPGLVDIVEVEGYGHLDLIIGRDAHVDGDGTGVFRRIAEALDRTA